MISEHLSNEDLQNIRDNKTTADYIKGKPLFTTRMLAIDLLASRQTIVELEDKLVNVNERLRAREDPFNHNLSDMSCAFIEYNAKMQDETIRELRRRLKAETIPDNVLDILIGASSDQAQNLPPYLPEFKYPYVDLIKHALAWLNSLHGQRQETKERCHADRDGDCDWEGCPQNRDGEPLHSGRSCPLIVNDEED